jgi:N-acetylmuramoyl-L-alanine amidase
MSKIKLCIDAGHGFSNRRPGVYDSGAQSGGVSEADIALAWALTGRWIAKQCGIETFLTRDDDSDPDPVGQRDDKAEMAGCTHFISLHCNCADGTARGTETFYRDERDMKLATIAQKAARISLGLKDRGLKTESSSQHSRLAIFDFDGPACLLELGFIDNEFDQAAMMLRDNRIDFWDEFLLGLGLVKL